MNTHWRYVLGLFLVGASLAACGKSGSEDNGGADLAVEIADCKHFPELCRCHADSDCGGTTPRCVADAGVCIPCLPDNRNTCPMGSYCAMGDAGWDCVANCSVAKDCADPRAACCNARCVDPVTDVRNCGACQHRLRVPSRRWSARLPGRQVRILPMQSRIPGLRPRLRQERLRGSDLQRREELRRLRQRMPRIPQWHRRLQVRQMRRHLHAGFLRL